MNSQTTSKNTISEDSWHFPIIGNLPTSEYRILRRLLHELGRRNIYMRYKYIARFYHSGVLEKMVQTLNATSRKRKRSKKERELPDAKRTTTERTEEQKPSNEKQEDDSALTDHDSNDGDSSDEAEAEAEDDDEMENEDENEKEYKNENLPSTGKYFYHLAWHSRHHVSTQTDGPIYLD